MAVCLADSYHTIQEGNVGIYFVNGRLDDNLSTPGGHWQLPFVTKHKEITVRRRTDTLLTVKAVGRNGTQYSFENIKVTYSVEQGSVIALVKELGEDFRNILIFDRIAEKIGMFCANHTTDEVSARPSGHISELGKI